MQYGLIGAGPVHKYLVSSLPRLGRELGLVASINRRTASRIVNTLRAGEACELEDVISASIVLVCAPDDHLQPLLVALERKKMDWRGKSIVLCECKAFSLELQSLQSAGASIASLRRLAGLQRRFLVEGNRVALRAARYVVQQLNCVCVEIRPEDHVFFSASLTFASSLFTPLLEGCMNAVRQTRLSGAHAGQLVEALFQETIRTYLYSGRRSWAGVIASGNTKAMDQEMNALATIQPALAEVYRTYAESSKRLLAPRRHAKTAPENI